MKRLIPVIHLVDTIQLIQNIERCISVGVKNVFIINHTTDIPELIKSANMIKEDYPDLWVGINVLSVKSAGISPVMKIQYAESFDGLWIDESLGLEDVRSKKFNGEIFSGLNFKYQKQYYGEELTEMIDLIKKTSTVACTSGVGTGKEASIDKIANLKELLGDFPLAIASGISSDNVENYLPYVDDFLVASSITDAKEYIIKDKLQELFDKIN